MYRCYKHGTLESEWCNDCEEIIECNCSAMEVARFKDLIYESKMGEKTITIFLQHCSTCGKPIYVKFNSQL